MRTTFTLILLLASPATLLAQQEQAEFSDYTQEERWDRATGLATVSITAAIRHAKEMGQEVDEFGHWWADLFDDSWGEPDSYGPTDVMRGMRRNWLSFHGGEVEILDASENEVTARFNRFYTETFGEDGMLYGVSLEEYERVFSIFNAAIADYHGLHYEEQREDGAWIMTFRRR